MIFKNEKTYDTLKYIALVVLPALGTLYFALASIWHLPYGEQIVGTITAIDTFLGALLQISNNKYNEIVAEFEAEEEKDHEIEEEEE